MHDTASTVVGNLPHPRLSSFIVPKDLVVDKRKAESEATAPVMYDHAPLWHNTGKPSDKNKTQKKQATGGRIDTCRIESGELDFLSLEDRLVVEHEPPPTKHFRNYGNPAPNNKITKAQRMVADIFAVLHKRDSTGEYAYNCAL